MKQLSNGIHPGFETLGDVNRSPKQGYQWPQRVIDVLQKFLKKFKKQFSIEE